MLRLLYPREREPVPIVQEAGWAQGPVWKLKVCHTIFLIGSDNNRNYV